MAYWTEDFVRDGSLRDIYVLGTTLDDWRSFLQLIADRRHHLTHDGVDAPMPADPATLFGTNHLLQFFVGTIDLDCHFFNHEEIELSFDPTAIDEHTIDNLLGFVTELSRTLGKNVIVTPENLPEEPIFRCEPDGRGPIYVPPP